MKQKFINYQNMPWKQLQELEMENSRLKKDLGSLRKSVVEADSTTAPKTLIGKFFHRLNDAQLYMKLAIKLYT